LDGLAAITGSHVNDEERAISDAIDDGLADTAGLPPPSCGGGM
jgi:hypothetical protein